MAYVCFIVDAFSRRIVGWRVAAHMRTEMVLDALEMAERPRRPSPGRARGPLRRRVAVHVVRFTERLDEIGARPSIGTVGGLLRQRAGRDDQRALQGRVRLRTRRHGWDDVDDLELATLSWVHWFNEQRLHGHRDDMPPAEFEAAFYAAQQADPAGVGTQYRRPAAGGLLGATTELRIVLHSEAGKLEARRPSPPSTRSPLPRPRSTTPCLTASKS